MKRSTLTVMFTIGLLFLGACSNDREIDTSGKGDRRVITNPYQIKDYLSTLQNPPGLRSEKAGALPNNGNPVPVGEGTTEELGSDVVNGMPGVWVKTTRHYKMDQAFDETILLDPTVDILYPGCVVRGASVSDATYAAISDCKVGDITFSISKVLKDGQSHELLKKTVPNIRMSDYREQFSKWSVLNYEPGAVTTMHSAEVVSSEQEVALKMGASFKHQLVDIAASLSFDFKNSDNHILAKFIQKQYSVTMDFPKTPTLFAEVDTKYINQYAPVYVSNINYGRMIFMAIDTKHSLADVQAALNVAVKSVNVNGNMDAHYKKVLSESRISMVAIGGGASEQNYVLENGWEGFKKFMTAEVPMAKLTPISFQLRYAVDNSLARVVRQTEYEVTRLEFVPKFDEVGIVFRLSGIKGSGGISESGADLEVYGKGWTQMAGISEALFFNRERNNYINVPKGGDFADAQGARTELKIRKPAGMKIDEFLRLRIRFYTHFYDNDAPSKDKDYGEVYEECSIRDILALQKAEDPSMVIGSSTMNCQVWGKLQFVDTYFLNSGKKVEMRWLPD